MKSKTTGIWFLVAGALFAILWLGGRHLQPPVQRPEALFPGLRASALTRLHLTLAGQPEIMVARRGGQWFLETPLAYPAQAAPLDALADSLEKLAAADRLSPAELRHVKDVDREYGFASPRFVLVAEYDGQRRQLLVGSTTAPGDQVFLRVIGQEGVYVADVRWLKLLPAAAADWRDTSLVDAGGACDWIIVTNGTKAMEFRRAPTNHVWRMTRPLQARADGRRLDAALQQLRAGRVARFVTDDPSADLAGYGLQPPAFSILLGQGTNLAGAVSAGSPVPDNPLQVFARRNSWNAVVTSSKDAFAAWRGGVNDYRDSHLFTLDSPVAEIAVRGPGDFTLQNLGTNGWAVAGDKFPADAGSIASFVQMLADLQVAEFVKDVVSPADLQGFGLAAPAREISLRARAGDTNSTLACLLFSAPETNRVLVKRADEEFIYALKPGDVARIPEHGWEFRDRKIWRFDPTNVVQLTIRQDGATRQLVRNGGGKWSFAAGSQGMIDSRSVEQTVQELASLTADGWVGRGITEPEKYGFNPANLSLTIELAGGEKHTVDFGAELAQGQTALASVTLGGERWAFVFPVIPYQLVAGNLTIPRNRP